MDSVVNSISQWIPVIGTLLGAGIGFAASFVNSKFNKAKEEALNRENRDRERIEKIYRLLVTINSERIHEMAEAINSIHYATPIKDKNPQDFPPLIELEMLVKLYFSNLEPQRIELMKYIHSFGEKYIEFRFKDYKNESLDVKQKDSGILVALSSKISEQIKLLQKSISIHVKA